MPEIWLNYGTTDVVLEIKAENLEQAIDSEGTVNYGMQGGDEAAGTSGPASGSGPGHGSGDRLDAAKGGADCTVGESDGGAHDAGSSSSNNNNGPGGALGAGDAAAMQSADGGVSPGTKKDVAAAPGRSRRADAPACLEPRDISERLGALDLSRPFDLVLMHDSQAVRQIVSSIFILCEQRTAPFPNVLADRGILSSVRAGLPEGAIANAFEARSMQLASGDTHGDGPGGEHAGRGRAGGRDSAVHADNGGAAADPAAAITAGSAPQGDSRGLVFVAETEFDGLFGYETVSTRLIRKFGGQAGQMLAAYAKREGNAPSPGRHTRSFAEAKKFADGFEIRAIDAVAHAGGITDLFVGHPSETCAQSSSSLESRSILDVDRQKAMIVSTGKSSSSATLGDALSSVWNCQAAVRNNGLLVLAAECSGGLGSDALRMHIEGRLPHERLGNPSAYVDGMEELLFLHETKKRFQIALVSVLPEMYTSKLGIISIGGMLQVVQYMQDTQGRGQKASVVMDGSRLLLR